MSTKPPIILLHGALGSVDQLTPMKEALALYFDVHPFGFSGHGGREAKGPFRVEQYARELRDWVKEKGLHQPWVWGYSLGGYVALYLALQEEGLFKGIATLATKFHWDPEQARKEGARLSPEFLLDKAPAFVDGLKQRHAPASWKDMLKNTAELMEALGEKPLLDHARLSSLPIPVLTMIGDKDRMVSLEETIQARQSLLSGSLAVLPSTGHPIEAMPADLVARLVERWMLSSRKEV